MTVPTVAELAATVEALAARVLALEAMVGDATPSSDDATVADRLARLEAVNPWIPSPAREVPQ